MNAGPINLFIWNLFYSLENKCIALIKFHQLTIFAGLCVCIYIYIYIYIYMHTQTRVTNNWAIGLMSRVFANGPGDWGSYQRLRKMVLDSTLLNIQHYKVRIKGNMGQSREWSNTLPYFCVEAIEKGPFGSPSTKVANFTYIYIYIYIYIWNKFWLVSKLFIFIINNIEILLN